MESKDLTGYISKAKKKTPVKVYITCSRPYGASGNALTFPKDCQVFSAGTAMIIFGDWAEIEPVLLHAGKKIKGCIVENNCRNSAIPLLDYKNHNARIEPGAIIRDRVEIGENAIIMMGAILNIGARVGANTMIDMGAILGGRALIGCNCHIGAGAVIAGVIEPPSQKPVVIGDGVMIGANAVVIEGVCVGNGAVIAAGAVVIDDVPANAVMAGVPAKLVKIKDSRTTSKTEMIESLRNL